MMPLKGHGDRKNMRWEVKLNINAFTFSHKKNLRSPDKLCVCSQNVQSFSGESKSSAREQGSQGKANVLLHFFHHLVTLGTPY